MMNKKYRYKNGIVKPPTSRKVMTKSQRLEARKNLQLYISLQINYFELKKQLDQMNSFIGFKFFKIRNESEE
jgi:hypothetical protein